MRSLRLTAALCSLLCFTSVLGASLTPELRRPAHAVGYLVSAQADESAAVGPLALPTRGPDVAGRRDIEGVIWTTVEWPWIGAPTADLSALIAELRAAGQPVVLQLRRDAGAPADGDQERHARLDAARTLARTFAGQVTWYLLDGLGSAPAAPDDDRRLAYEIKSAAVTLRAEDPGAGIAVRVASVEALEQLARAYRAVGDLDPYIDAVAWRVPFEMAADDAARALRAVLDESDPGASAWIESDSPAAVLEGAAFDDAVLRRSAELMAARVDLALFRLPPAASKTPVVGRRAPAGARGLMTIARTVTPAMSLSPRENSGIVAEAGGLPIAWARFFDDQHFEEAIVYWAAGDGEVPADARAKFVFETALRRGYRVLDPVTGTPGSVSTEAVDAGHARLEVPLAWRPRLIVFTLAKSSLDIPVEPAQSDVAGSHVVTAQEVIAAHQRWRAFQDDRLRTVQRDGRITFRTRFGQQTGTFDVTIQADYLWDRESGAEWVVRGTYFNGVKLNWDKIPEVPFLSQESVMQLPLDLNLDKRYDYTLESEEKVEGRLCWRLAFRPLDKAVSLYKGTAWIDQVSHALVKVETLQTNLKAPLISSDDVQFFAPVEGPDGTVYWVLERIEGQQIYTINGTNLVVEKRNAFGPARINDPGFDAARDAVQASTAQIMRETPRGLKWFDRDATGKRVIREKGKPTQLFAVAGAFKDNGIDKVAPLLGINYTNIDTFGKGKIFNLFFAGLLANASLSDPSLWGTRLDAGVTMTLNGYAATEREYAQGVENESQRLGRRSQAARISLGYPLGNFVKLRGVGELSYDRYFQSDTTEDFTVPSSHWERLGKLELAFDRKGWGLLASTTGVARSTWDCWGADATLIDPETNRCARDVARAKNFTTYALGAQKSWFLPYFQKIETSVTYRAGSDLDRFSAFTFGFLSGDRVRGFGGAGIRYDRGTVAELGYSFNLADVVRFDATIDHARVHPLADDLATAGVADEAGSDLERHTGVGFAANFVGPWRTLIRLDTGYALKSDLAAVEGNKEFLILVLRLF